MEEKQEVIQERGEQKDERIFRKKKSTYINKWGEGKEKQDKSKGSRADK